MLKTNGFTIIEILISLTLLGLMIFTMLSTNVMLSAGANQQEQQYYALQQHKNIKELLNVTQSEQLINEWKHETTAFLPNAKTSISFHNLQPIIIISWGKNQSLNSK